MQITLDTAKAVCRHTGIAISTRCCRIAGNRPHRTNRFLLRQDGMAGRLHMCQRRLNSDPPFGNSPK